MTPKSAETELKPCPFCDSSDIWVLTDAAFCKGCGVRTPQTFSSQEEAAAFWNRRTGRLSSERDELVERCAKVFEKDAQSRTPVAEWSKGYVAALYDVAAYLRSLSKPQEGGEK